MRLHSLEGVLAAAMVYQYSDERSPNKGATPLEIPRVSDQDFTKEDVS